MLILSHFPLDNKTFSSAKYVSYKEQIFSHLCKIHDMFLCTLAKLYRSCSGIGPHNQANPSLNYAVHLCSLQLPQCSIKRIKGQRKWCQIPVFKTVNTINICMPFPLKIIDQTLKVELLVKLPAIKVLERLAPFVPSAQLSTAAHQILRMLITWFF